jgi:FAD:protein FMN transferase
MTNGQNFQSTALSRFCFPFRAMACDNDIQLYASDKEQADCAADAAISEVKRIEAKYSRYLDESVVTRINQAAGGEPVLVDDETQSLLNYAEICYQQSEGLFDITSGVLRRIWNFKSNKIPSNTSIGAVLEQIGWNKVEIHDQHIRLPVVGMEIDFGGFGKEYAVDRAGAVLASYGITSAMINLGGDLAVLGPHPDNSPWCVGLRHPRTDSVLLATLPITTGAIASSGDYERYIDFEGKHYSHILNPRTGWPVQNSFQSVTVHAPSCLVAGSATTIAMLKGEAAGLSWLENLRLPFIAVNAKGSIFSALSHDG